MTQSPKLSSSLNFAALKSYCLSWAGTSLDFPFGPEIAVFRVEGKMFALTAWDQLPLAINLKCEPTLAELLRQEYDAVKPGWHMNKRHWNTVSVGGDLPDEKVKDQIWRSYELVLKGLPKKRQSALNLLNQA